MQDLCLPLVNVMPLAERAYGRYGRRNAMAVAIAGQKNQTGIELKVAEFGLRCGGYLSHEARSHAHQVRELPLPTIDPLFVPLSRGRLPGCYLGAGIGGFTAVFAVASLNEGEWSEAIACLLSVEAIREKDKRERARALLARYIAQNKYAHLVSTPLV